MTIIVQKYGGTSMASIEKIQNIAQRIIHKKNEGQQLVVVVSAMGKSTDDLLDMAYNMGNNPSKRELDMLLSTGEQVSSSLLSIALNGLGYKAISFTGHQAGIKTAGSHTNSRIAEINCERLKNELNDNKIVIVAGFQGINENNDITTLGRGGSDTTAVAIAASLNSVCEIYTDVDGVYSVDPRVYPKAKKLSNISYEEMLEMARLGAGIMHARAVELGEKFNVPIYVASSTENIPGTMIKEGDHMMEGGAITGMAINNDDAMISLNNIPYQVELIAAIFNDLAEKEINIDMISQAFPKNAQVSISFTLPKSDLPEGKKIIQSYMDEYPEMEVDINSDITKLSVVGTGMRQQSGVAAKLFTLLPQNNIALHMVTTSEIKISYVIDPKDQQKAIQIVANEFNL